MKKFLLFSILFFFVFSLAAQQQVTNGKEIFVVPREIHPGYINDYTAPAIPGQKSFSTVQIGTTWYDSQTVNYGNVMNRVYAFPDGTIGATWQGAGEDANPDRGTAYNYYDGSEWGEQSPHIGPDPRTGWPSYAAWGPNGEILCHYFYVTNASPIKFYRRETKGEGEWIESQCDGPDNYSIVWHSMITSGENNEYIHLLAYTYDDVYMGQTNALLYYRSSDGGETWEIEHELIEGLGEDYFPTINALSYEWANPVGNTIAFGYGFREYGGLVFKSYDNGDTWEKIEALISPFDPFETYLESPDFGSGVGSFDLALDSQGKAHVIFSRMIGSFNDAGEWGYYPFTDGVIYWNEDMDPLDTTLISSYTTEFLEENGYLCGWMLSDDPITIPEGQPNYANAACGFPQISIDANDRMFVSWSAIAPGYNTGGSPDLLYRHIVMNASFDGGNWWNGPFDMNTEITWILSDCIYSEQPPYLPGNMVYVLFQEDNIPGTYEWPSEQASPTENRIHCIELPVGSFVGVGETPETPSYSVSSLYPNPSEQMVKFGVELQEPSSVSISVTNLVGQLVKYTDLGTLSVGKHLRKLNVSDLNTGIYNLTVGVNNQKTTQKLIVN